MNLVGKAGSALGNAVTPARAAISRWVTAALNAGRVAGATGAGDLGDLGDFVVVAAAVAAASAAFAVAIALFWHS